MPASKLLLRVSRRRRPPEKVCPAGTWQRRILLWKGSDLRVARPPVQQQTLPRAARLPQPQSLPLSLAQQLQTSLTQGPLVLQTP